MRLVEDASPGRAAKLRHSVDIRRGRSVAALAALAIFTMSSCTVGPSVRPPLATMGGSPPASSTQLSTPMTMPTGPGGPGQSAPPLAWQECPPGVDSATDGSTFAVRCANLAVPLSYQQPGRGRLTIKVAEARDPGVPAAAPSLVVAQGDPGAAPYTDVADIAAALPQAIRQHFAIVTLDPRGTGDSTGAVCVTPDTAAAMIGMSADPATAAGGSQLGAISRQLTFDCGDVLGPLLTAINSTNAADDLDTLRAALGLSTLSILASGGSATIAAVYADRYPGRVGAMVLESPADPLATPQQRATSSAAAAETLFDDFAAACAHFDGGCPLGTDPRAAVTKLVDRLATSGVSTGAWVMTGGSVLTALVRQLPDQTSWPALAAAIGSLDSGDAAPLARTLTTVDDGPALMERLSGHILYRCNDSSVRMSPDAITSAAKAARSAAPLFGPFAVGAAALCSAWPAPDQPLGRLLADGAPPIIIIGATRNPIHSYVAAQSIAGQLASAVLVTWQSGSDDAYPENSCVRSAVDEYLLQRATPARGLLCPP